MKYLILDAGGGKVDVAVHEIVSRNYLKEIASACGGRWGGTTIDSAFEKLIEDIVGAEVYNQFVENHLDDFIDLMRSFEVKKRHFSTEAERGLVCMLPLSLLDLYRRQTGIELGKNEIKDGIKISRNKLLCSKTVCEQLFVETCDNITEHLRKIIEPDEIGKISVIMMVGGFSESSFLQDAVKRSFPDVNVVVPRDASLCVLKGAVMYGHCSNVISERVVKYTYGTNVYKPFDNDMHPVSKLVLTDSGPFCKDLFSPYVRQGQIVKVGKPQMHKLYQPMKSSQKKMFLAIYASEFPSPRFVTEPGCTRIGTIIVDMPDTAGDLEREVMVIFTFSGTELTVTAKDITSGSVSDVSVDLLS